METPSDNPYEYREPREPSPPAEGAFKLEIGEFSYEVSESAWSAGKNAGLKKVLVVFLLVFISLVSSLFYVIPLGVIISLGLMPAFFYLESWELFSKIAIVIFLFSISSFFAVLPLVIVGIFYYSMSRFEYWLAQKIFGFSILVPDDAILCSFAFSPRQSKYHYSFDKIDDIGWVRVEAEGIRMEGEHTKLFLPAKMMSKLSLHTRYFWSLGGRRIRVALQFAEKLPFNSLEFELIERTIFGNRIKSKKMKEEIESIAARY